MKFFLQFLLFILFSFHSRGQSVHLDSLLKEVFPALFIKNMGPSKLIIVQVDTMNSFVDFIFNDKSFGIDTIVKSDNALISWLSKNQEGLLVRISSKRIQEDIILCEIGCFFIDTKTFNDSKRILSFLEEHTVKLVKYKDIWKYKRC